MKFLCYILTFIFATFLSSCAWSPPYIEKIVKLVNDESDTNLKPTLNWTTNQQTVVESTSQIFLTLTSSFAVSQALPISFSINNLNLTPLQDYTLPSNSITIPAGQTSATLVVNIINDTLDENDETINFKIATSTDYLVGAVSNQTITIQDNDLPPTVNISSVSVNESESQITIPVTLSAVSAKPIQFNWQTVSATAQANIDYTSVSSTLVLIPAGVSSTTISVPLLSDSIDESTENFNIEIFNSVNTLNSAVSAPQSIVDADFYFNFMQGTLPVSGLTFTRNSTANYINSSGRMVLATANTPRFDYDPVSLQLKGLLIEQSTINLTLRSERFDIQTENSEPIWQRSAVSVTSNSTSAPTQALTADLWLEDLTLNEHSLTISRTSVSGTMGSYTNIASTANVDFCFSIFTKRYLTQPRDQVFLKLVDSANAANYIQAIYDIQNNTLVSTTEPGTGQLATGGAYIEPMADGWKRLILCGTVNNIQDTSARVQIGGALSGSINYTGTNAGFYLWGSQLETGTNVRQASSYKESDGSQRTRSRDTLTVDGFPSSSFTTQEFTTIYDYTTHKISADNVNIIGSICVLSSCSTNSIQILNDVNDMTLRVFNSGIASDFRTFSPLLSYSNYQVGLTKTNDNFIQYFENGLSYPAQGPYVIPAVNSWQIGSNGGGGRLNGHIRKATFRNRSLSPALMQTLTSD